MNSALVDRLHKNARRVEIAEIALIGLGHASIADLLQDVVLDLRAVAMLPLEVLTSSKRGLAASDDGGIGFWRAVLFFGVPIGLLFWGAIVYVALRLVH